MMKLSRSFALRSILFPLTVIVTAGAALNACYQVDGKLLGMEVSHAAEIKAAMKHQTNTPETITDRATAPTLQQLSQYQWTLSAVTQQDAPLTAYADVIKNQTAKLKFSDEQMADGGVMINYTLGCNQLSASASLAADSLSINKNTLLSTKKGCPSDFPDESGFAQKMDGSSLTFKSNPAEHTAVLTQTKGSQHIVWTGVMTDEARYGQAAQLYWEVDAPPIACATAQGEQKSCLRVRNVNYNEDGLKVGVGAWRTFYGNIHGYQHQLNQREIIRIHAYSSPNSSENPRYVFDSVIEATVLN